MRSSGKCKSRIISRARSAPSCGGGGGGTFILNPVNVMVTRFVDSHDIPSDEKNLSLPVSSVEPAPLIFREAFSTPAPFIFVDGLGMSSRGFPDAP